MVIRFINNDYDNAWRWFVDGSNDEFRDYPDPFSWPTHEQMLEWFEKKIGGEDGD